MPDLKSFEACCSLLFYIFFCSASNRQASPWQSWNSHTGGVSPYSSVMKWAKYLRKFFHIKHYRKQHHCEWKEDSDLTGQGRLSFNSVNLTGDSGSWGDTSQVTICTFGVLQCWNSLLHTLDSNMNIILERAKKTIYFWPTSPFF